MANIKITDLTAYGNPTSTDVLPIVDVGADVTKKVSVGDLLKNDPGTAALPGIAFDGDPNTGIYSPGADQLAISTNGAGRLFVNDSGNVGIGTANPGSILDVRDTRNAAASINLYGARSNSGNNAFFSGNSSRGSISSPETLIADDIIATFLASGHDGTDYLSGGRIRFRVETISTGSLNSNIEFLVSNGASETEAFRITSDRYVRFASGSGGIQFNGDTAAANALDDYEEGTWTPTFGDGGGAVTVSGGSINAKYTKIGRLVHVDILLSNVTISGSTTGGAFMTLPFVPVSADSFVPNLNFSAVNDVRVGRSEAAGLKLTFFTNLSNTLSTWQNGSGRSLYVSGTYRV